MQIRVKVHANARKELVTIVSNTLLEISVKEKPLENRANERVLTLVAAHFRLPIRKVRLVRGHKRPSKIISIE